MAFVNPISSKYKSAIREKAIQRSETRTVLAGRKPEDFSPGDLEVVVREEEMKINSELKEKGLLAVLALLGLSWFG